MLRVAEHVERTDTGRQRRANEDSLLRPLAAVRDRRRDGRRPGRRGRLDRRRRGPRAGAARRTAARRGAPRRRACARPTRASTSSPADHDLRGDGHDAHRRLRRRARGHDRPRRRQPRLPAPRRRARAADRGPHARRGARPAGQAHARGGRRAPPALDHHPRARARSSACEPDTAHVPGPRRRRLPHLLRRPDLDGRRGPRRAARRGGTARCGRRARARRRGERRGRPRQHHGRPLPPRGGRRRAGAAETEQPTSTGEAVTVHGGGPDAAAATAASAGEPSTAVHEAWRPSDAPVEPTGVVPRTPLPPRARRDRRTGQRPPPPAARADRADPGHVPRRLRARRLLLRLADRLLRGDEPRRLRHGLPRAALRAAGGAGPLLARTTSPACPRRRWPARQRDTVTGHKLRSKGDAQDYVRRLEQGRVQP